MRLVTYRAGRRVSVGVVEGEHIVDLGESFGSMRMLIEAGVEGLGRVRDLLEERREALPLASVRLLAPIPDPARNLWAVGWNYLEHFSEGVGKRDDDVVELPDHPTFFTKATMTLIGPTDPIAHDVDLSRHMDYEAELVAVIGRSGRSIPEEHALDHVFGYTVANDVTARDIQRRHGGQWVKGKSIDLTCPIGPWIVTADELGDPQQLTLRCEVNGAIMQEKTTAAMAFPVARLIAELSDGLSLLPGDLILTGTPEGVGYARRPPRFLAPGDLVVTEIDGIGRLENMVAERDLSSYTTRSGAGTDDG